MTVALSALGIVLVAWGFWTTRQDRRLADQIWFLASGVLSVVVLALVVFVPQALNAWWALDTAVLKADSNEIVVVPRDRPKDKGRLLSKETWADAASEAIRQDDVVMRIETAKIGPLSIDG